MLTEAFEESKEAELQDGFFEIYEVYFISETTRLKSVLGYFSYHPVANAYAVGKGEWGGKASVQARKALRFNGEYYLLERETPIDLDRNKAKSDEELKKRTLDALSYDQKRVLGLLEKK